MTMLLNHRLSSSRFHRELIHATRVMAVTVPAAMRWNPVGEPSSAQTAAFAKIGMTAIMVYRPSLVTAKMPVSSAAHRQIVHTARSEPSAVPTGGSSASRYLNEPSMLIHPCLMVRTVGMIWAMVVSLSIKAGPTTSCANAMNSICHHRRSTGKRPASATSEPMMVAGIAAVAHDSADP